MDKYEELWLYHKEGIDNLYKSCESLLLKTVTDKTIMRFHCYKILKEMMERTESNEVFNSSYEEMYRHFKTKLGIIISVMPLSLMKTEENEYTYYFLKEFNNNLEEIEKIKELL